MERVYSLLLGAAVTLGVLGVVAGVVSLATPPPDTDLGSRVVVDAGPGVQAPTDAVPPVTPSTPPGGTPPEGGPPADDGSPASVPVNPPVVVDDDDDDDDDDDGGDD